VFQADGIRILTSPPQAPRANAICERMTGTLRREVPGQLLIVALKGNPPASRVINLSGQNS
jgi:hypothetical protein